MKLADGRYADETMQQGAQAFAAITKSDSTVLTGVRAIYVGGAGDVSVDDQNDVEVVFKAVPVGTTLWISPKRVNSTNTTATLMVALY